MPNLEGYRKFLIALVGLAATDIPLFQSHPALAGELSAGIAAAFMLANAVENIAKMFLESKKAGSQAVTPLTA